MIIYKIINKVNGKIYIGQTVQPLTQRWSKHCNQTKGTYIKSAIDKHGRDNFTIEEIDRAETLDELNQKEVYWIEFYKSRDREIGYNLKEGGDSSPCHEETKLKIGFANSNRTVSPETRAKQSAARKGKPLSEETKQRMSEARKGHKVSEGTRAKIGAKHKGKIITDEQRLKMSEARGNKPSMTPEKYKEVGLRKRGIKRPEIGDRLRGVKRPPEVIEKGRLKRLGQKRTEEQKERMRASFKGGRTGQKNSVESIQKQKETKARLKAEREKK